MKKAMLYIHGKGGSAAQAGQYRPACGGFELIGADYGDYLPWIVREQMELLYEWLRRAL